MFYLCCIFFILYICCICMLYICFIYVVHMLYVCCKYVVYILVALASQRGLHGLSVALEALPGNGMDCI